MARKEWLINGDRSSKFFQNRANLRRKRKLVMKLRDDCGIWIDDQKLIADKFISDYTQRFKSAHNTHRVILNMGIPELISDNDNAKLTKLPNIDEVKDALWHRFY